MQLGKCEAFNFGSYEHFEFDFSNTSLSLIYGSTGAGKSTIPDIPCWCLFGKTAKDGNVDEVRNWQNQGQETKVTLEVSSAAWTPVVVTRIRGKTSSQNDLYWTEVSSSETKIRGKDLVETQKLLEKRLGIDYLLYTTGSYFSEFSPTGKFFTAKAKDKREIFEKITSLTLPVKIAEAVVEEKKKTKKEISELELQIATLTGKLQQARATKKRAEESKLEWEISHQETLLRLNRQLESFAIEKASKIEAARLKCESWNKARDKSVDLLIAKIETLVDKVRPDSYYLAHIQELEAIKSKSDKCSKCGAPVQDKALQGSIDAIKEDRRENMRRGDQLQDYKERLQEASEQTNPFEEQLQQAQDSKNVYGEQLEREKGSINPFDAQISQLSASIKSWEKESNQLKASLIKAEHRLTSLVQLYDFSFCLRGELLKNAVKEIEDSTNDYLTQYFDGIFKVTFTLEDADSVKVEIQKNGYDCVYHQLSKGQRGVLRLAFVVSMMKATANQAGIHFNSLFFDESLDGLDDDHKTKAFGLFQELEQDHESVLVIDHCENFQNLFTSRYKVSMTEDFSSLELQDE